MREKIICGDGTVQTANSSVKIHSRHTVCKARRDSDSDNAPTTLKESLELTDPASEASSGKSYESNVLLGAVTED